MKKERRFQCRETTRVPISCLMEENGCPCQAVICNVSQNGIYLESSRKFSPGDSFFLTTDGPSSTGTAIPYDVYAAQVKWCRKIEKASGFGVGVEQTGKAFMVKAPDPQLKLSRCEFCGSSPKKPMVRTDDHLSLCQNCFLRLSQLPKKSIKSNLTRFLTGNVL